VRMQPATVEKALTSAGKNIDTPYCSLSTREREAVVAFTF